MAGNRRNTKQEVIDLLQVMYKHSHAMARIYGNDGDKEMADHYVAQAMAYNTAIDLLTKPDYYEQIYKIFHKEDEA